MDTVKSNAEAYIVCARTSTKPPKGRRRRNSQSRSSVPCVVEKKNVVVKTKVRFLFCPPKFSLEKRGRKAPLCRCRRRELSFVSLRRRRKKRALFRRAPLLLLLPYLFSLSTFSSFSSFPSRAFFSISVTFRPDFKGSTFSLDVSQDGGGGCCWRLRCSAMCVVVVVVSSSPL